MKLKRSTVILESVFHSKSYCDGNNCKKKQIFGHMAESTVRNSN